MGSPLPRLLTVVALATACAAAPPISTASVVPPTAATSSSAAATTSAAPSTPSGPTAVSTGAIDSCGTVANWKGDGAQMVVDLVADGVTTQYNLQYQFAYPKDSAAAQAALIRAAVNSTQVLQLRGRQVAPDSGLQRTIQLREYMVTQVGACSPTASVQPRPSDFVLPPGCGYAGAPTVGTDLSAWKFDCGEGANHDARAALAYSLSQQGWTGCGVGLGSATWKKGDLEEGRPGTNRLGGVWRARAQWPSDPDPTCPRRSDRLRVETS